jgi:hypothetical protein
MLIGIAGVMAVSVGSIQTNPVLDGLEDWVEVGVSTSRATALSLRRDEFGYGNY